MLAKRLPLLWAFAGGCIASGALLGFLREEATAVPAQAVHVRAAGPHGDAPVKDAIEPAIAVAEAARAPVKEAADTEPKADSGSSVADVLSRLEAAYRQRLAPVAQQEELSTSQATTALDPATPLPSPEPAGATTTPVASVRAESAPKLDAASEVAPEAAVERAVPVPAAPAPVVVAQNDAPARGISVGDVHVGDVHQNTRVDSVHQGDVYAVQQQLMVLQYLQLVGQSPHARLAAPTREPRQVSTRRPAAFSLPLTNPDNPWGFDFPPTVLAK